MMWARPTGIDHWWSCSHTTIMVEGGQCLSRCLFLDSVLAGASAPPILNASDCDHD